MTEPAPNPGTQTAAQAWARYKRLMRFMMTVTLLMVGASFVAIYRENGLVSAHFYIATALGIGFAMLLMSALMGLVFLSNNSGHDDKVAQPFHDEDSNFSD